MEPTHGSAPADCHKIFKGYMGFALPAILSAYILGQLMAYLTGGSHPLTLFIIISLFIIFVSISRGRRISDLAFRLKIFLLFAPLVSGHFLMSAAISSPPIEERMNLEAGERLQLVGELYRPVEYLTDTSRIYLDRCRVVRGGAVEELSGRVRITVRESGGGLKVGDIVSVSDVRLHSPKNFNNPGSFNYESYMKVQRMDAVGGVSSLSRIQRLGRDDSFNVVRSVQRLKEDLMAKVDGALSSDRASLFKAVVLGERGALDRGTQDAFVKAGTAHLLAISGLHVGFVAIFSFHLIRFLIRLVKIRIFKRVGDPLLPSRLASLITVAPVLFYSLLVGGRISCIRATVMIVVYLLARFLYRERHLYGTVSLAGLAILVWNPLALFDIGFQFSFLTVFALIYANSSTPLFRLGWDDSPVPIRHERARLGLRRLLIFPLISAVAGIALLPLTAYYFNQVSPGGLIANTVAVPVAMLTIPLGLAASLLSFLPGPITSYLLYISGEAVFLLSRLSGLTASLKFGPLSSSYSVFPPPVPAVIAYYVMGFSLFRLKRERWAPVVVAVSLALFFGSIAWKTIAAGHGNTLRVTFFDVGQGDSALLELPGGGRALVDGGGIYGGSFNVGESVIAPYLRRRWMGSLDLLISSHPHPDHLGGLLALLDEFPVSAYWESIGAEDFNSPIHGRVMELTGAKGVRVVRYERGADTKGIGGVRFHIFHPSREFTRMLAEEGVEEDLFLNDTSLVLGVIYGQVSFLFTGDIGRRAQEDILGLEEPLRHSVLKVPHHGGGHSNTWEFLEAVGPEVAVVSVGEFNPYGHPSPKVLKDLREIGARVYRTDRCGAVTVETDGEAIWAKTFLGDRVGGECSSYEVREGTK